MTPYEIALSLTFALLLSSTFLVRRMTPVELKQCQFCGHWPGTGRGE